MSNPPPKAELAPEPKGKDWAEFLANSPPDSSSEIRNLWVRNENRPRLQTPNVFLYCEFEACDGYRFFEYFSGTTYESDEWSFRFLHYRCRNCREKTKTYAIAVKPTSNPPTGHAEKFGENPPFGPHTPARVFKLIGEENRELFLQGRRAENRGMGIGAFAYYRRVVENQKTRIIGEIAKVAAKLGAKADVLEEFKAAARRRNLPRLSSR